MFPAAGPGCEAPAGGLRFYPEDVLGKSKRIKTTRFDSCRTGAETGGDTGLRKRIYAPIKLYMVNMGIYSAMTMKPITMPIITVIIGSSMDNALALACSTSLSK